jgi:hypothetical protein
MSYSLKQIPTSLKTFKNIGSQKGITGACTLYQLPVLSNPRENIKHKNGLGQKSSFESSLGSLSNQFQENGVYNKLNLKIQKRKPKENINFLNRNGSMKAQVNSF